MWQYNNELYHHGVKGQKWGIRRFQNPDGSLTDEGRRRNGNKIIDSIRDEYRHQKQKRAERKEYKKAKRIVEGEKARKNGEFIFSNNLSTRSKMFATNVGSEIVKQYAKSYLDNHRAVLITKSNMVVPLSDISSSAINAGRLAINTYMGVKNYNRNRAIKEYDNASYKERKQAKETIAKYESRYK
jgi:RecA/RadA recombinase